MTKPKSEYPSKVEAGIRQWAKEHWAPRSLVQLADALGIPRVTFQHILRADRTLTGDNRAYYACLFLIGIPETDPRTIAPIHMQLGKAPTTKHVAWSEEQWQTWLTTDEAKQIASLNYQPPLNDSWEVILARDLKELCSFMEWSDLNELRESLGISREHWDVIVSGATIIDAPNDSNPYARLYYGLGIGDPRTLPQMDVTDPKGRFVRKRQWPENRLIFWERKMGLDDIPDERGWREWWDLNEEQIYLSVATLAVESFPSDVFSSESAVAPTSPLLEMHDSVLPAELAQLAEEAVLPPVSIPMQSSAAPKTVSFEAVLGMLGAYMDSTNRQRADESVALVAAFQQELKNAFGEVIVHVTTQAEESRREFKRLLQEQLDGIIEQVRAEILQDLEPLRQQIRELAEQKVDKPDTVQLATILQTMAEKLDSLSVSWQVPEKPTPKQQRDKMQEIAVLARQLTGLLQEFWGAKNQDRDQLVASNGVLLGKLLTVLDPLTLPAEKREQSIGLAKEVNE